MPSRMHGLEPAPRPRDQQRGRDHARREHELRGRVPPAGPATGRPCWPAAVPPTATTNTMRISPRYRGSEPRWVTAVTSAATSSSRRMNRRYTRSASGPWYARGLPALDAVADRRTAARRTAGSRAVRTNVGVNPAHSDQVPGLALGVGVGVRRQQVLAQLRQERDGQPEDREDHRRPHEQQRRVRDRRRARPGRARPRGSRCRARCDSLTCSGTTAGFVENAPHQSRSPYATVSTEPTDTATSTIIPAVVSSRCPSASSPASLATYPANGGSPIIDAVASAPASAVSWRLPADPRQPPQVTRAGRGVDHADDEEQRRLEHRVRAQHRQARERGVAWVPQPTSSMIRPSWLTVPNARMSLRSCCRSAR